MPGRMYFTIIYAAIFFVLCSQFSAFSATDTNPTGSTKSWWFGTTGNDIYTNNGTIDNDIDMTNGGVDTVYNTGTVSRDVLFGDTDGNHFSNTGSVVQILAESGSNNTYYNHSGATATRLYGSRNTSSNDNGGSNIIINNGTLPIKIGSYNTASSSSGGSNTITIGTNGFSDDVCGSFNSGSNTSGGSNTITNAGTISAQIVGSHNIGDYSSGGSNNISISGSAPLIYGSYNVGVSSSGGENTITVSGTISNGIIGSVNSDVDTHGGSNVIIVESSGSVDSITGSANNLDDTYGGDNTVIVRGGADIVYGSYNAAYNNAGGGNSIDISGTVTSNVYGSYNFGDNTTGNGNCISNSGTVGGSIFGSSLLGTGSSGGSNTIDNSGSVTNIMGSHSTAANTTGNGNTITNSGTVSISIVGSMNGGRDSIGGSNTIINSGIVAENIYGSYNGGDGSSGGSNTTLNVATVNGDLDGSFNIGDSTTGDDNTITNSGSVAGSINGSINTGTESYGGGNTITNSGTVDGDIIGSYNIGNNSSGGDNTIINSGTVGGSISGSRNNGGNSSGGNTITNSGSVSGSIYGSVNHGAGSRGAGNNITNSGTVGGDIHSGDGDDSVTIQVSSSVAGDIDGEDGEDTLIFENLSIIDGSQYLNFEYLTQSGSSSLTSTLNIAVSSIISGLLSVNGVLNSPTVTIASTATLGGTGTVNGEVTTYGVIAPGNSIGTLTVDGNVTFASGSGYVVDVGLNGTADILASTGTISIDDSTLWLSMYDRSQLFTGSSTVEIMRGDNGIQGTFDDVVFTANTITHSITYLANSIEVEFTRISYSELAATPVQRTMALALDSLLNSASGDMLALLLSLDYDYTLLELQQTLERISPEVYFGYLDSAQQTALLLGNQIIDRAAYLRDLKRGDASCSQAGLPGLNAGAPISADSQWTAWMRGIGGWSHSGARDGYMAYSAGTTGLLIGVDGPLTSWLTAGINYAYTSTDLNWSRDGLKGNQYGNHAGAFVSADFKGFYGDASLGFGFLKSKGRRDITLPNQSISAHADFDTITWLTQVNIGYDFEFNDFSLGPFAAIQHLALHQDSFTETDAGYLNLHVDDVNQSRTSSTFGGRLDYTLDLGNVQLIARAKAGWRHRFDNERTDLDAYFQDYADNAFTLTGLEPQSDALVLQTGVTLLGGEHFMASLDYALGHGSRDTTHSLGLSLGIRF